MSLLNLESSNLDSLKKVILDFIRDIKDNVLTLPKEQTHMVKLEVFFECMRADIIAKHVQKKVLPFKKQIENREEQFFRDNTFIFSGLPEEHMAYYTSILSDSDRFDEDDKKAVWAYFDIIIDLIEQYKKNK